MIQPLKSIPMDHVKDNTTRNSDEEEPIEETLSAEKTAMKRNISHSGSDNESSEDEGIVKHGPIKKQKLNSTDNESLRRLENSKPSLIDELNDMSFGSKNIDTKKDG